MRSKASIISTGFLLGIIKVAFGIGGVLWGASMGLMFEESYAMRYEEVPVWAVILPVFMCVMGFMAIILGLIFPILYIKEWSGTPIEQNGRILDIIKRAKNGDMVVLVEFCSGLRKELIASKKLYLSAGDAGFIGAQGKHLVYIKRGQ